MKLFVVRSQRTRDRIRSLAHSKGLTAGGQASTISTLGRASSALRSQPYANVRHKEEKKKDRNKTFTEKRE